MAEAGYQIGKRFFPFPASFRLGDPVLIRDLTGMSWEEFVNAMPDEDDPDAIGDPVVMLGMLGVAVWQTNPTWRRDRVVKYVQNVMIEDVEAVGIDDEEGVEEGDAGPPVVTNGSQAYERTAETSSSDSDSTSESSNPKPFGNQQLATTPE